MVFCFFFQVQLVLTLINFSAANSSSIDNNETSDEENSYKYPELDYTSNPYWLAFSKKSKSDLREHDRLELMLVEVRRLDFEVMEAW